MEEFSWKNEQGLKIYAVDWKTDQPQAVVGIIHGLGEHCRRYDALAAFFNANGIAVVGYDRQGFGRSEGPRGYTSHYRNYLDGVAQLRVQCERRYPRLPIFLFGQSMGGQLLLHYLIHRKPSLHGAIVSSPHIAEAFTPNPVIVGLGKFMRQVYPALTLSNQLNPDDLSRDAKVVADYRNDPQNHDRLSCGVGIALLERGKFLQEYSGGLTVPTLLLHGTADRITSHAASEAFASRNPDQLTFESVPGGYHELHHEPDKEDYRNRILAWLNARL
ncbi:alpha/beta hydrolase [Neolewinella litorea]|uniref:Alpha/beta hydrolase n=1 Tax=Neolewinella litorea TaxID=2562452 RepID=A0A4S4NND0_9BACT|nr:alpha/beta hydrolase [Neolewinella litorea]THH41484.1 alpha/beta hydrolase [Neolewinella litorea]